MLFVTVGSAGAYAFISPFAKPDDDSRYDEEINKAAATGFVFGMVLGAGVGLLSGVSDSMPAAMVKQIEKGVLPTLADFPFRGSMVEKIIDYGTNNTGRSFIELQPEDTRGDSPGDVDAILEVSSLRISLQRIDNRLQLFVEVQASLTENDAGTVLASRRFCHAWKTLYSRERKAFVGLMTREEVSGYLRILSEDVVDTVFLEESIPELYDNGTAMFYTQSDGLHPVFPKKGSGLSNKPTSVDSLRPRLEWAPFPGKSDIEKDAKGIWAGIGQVSYDLRIWRLADETDANSELVYEREKLNDPWHTVEDPLTPGSTYYYAVRARFVRNGLPAMTKWTAYPGLLPLLTRENLTFPGTYSFAFFTPGTKAKDTPPAGKTIVTAEERTLENLVSVSALKGWQNTGITVEKGDRIQIEYIAGKWTKDYDRNMVDADGIKRTRGGILPDSPNCSLIGRIGDGGPFFIGNHCEIEEADSTGELRLTINDNSWNDGLGYLKIQISVIRKTN